MTYKANSEPASPISQASSSVASQQTVPAYATRSQRDRVDLHFGLRTPHRKLEVVMETPAGDLSSVESFSSVIASSLMTFGGGQFGNLPPPPIPLCRMVHMHRVRVLHSGSVGIDELKEEFMDHGYVETQPKFYVVATDSDGNEMPVTDEIRDSWDDVWKIQNTQFELECETGDDFKYLKGKMFSVFDGNHRLHAWMALSKEHPLDLKFHPRVQAAVFRPEVSNFNRITTAMHSTNR